MRRLALTSPEMRGEDIRNLQHILNERLGHYRSRTRITQNGIYDRETAHAVAIIAAAMGLQHFDGQPSVTRVIEHPHFRTPADLVREGQRARLREKHDTVIGGGVQGLARVVRAAEHYIGVRENPPGSNWGSPEPKGWEEHFGFDSGVSWCGCFAGNMVIAAGGHVDSRVAFCPYIEADARSKTNGFDLWRPNHNEGIEPGWLALFNWSGGNDAEHVEIVKHIEATHVVCLGGNTSGSDPSNGGEVAEMVRPYQFVLGYARPRI